MDALSDVLGMVRALARANKTMNLLPSVTEFIQFYYLDFPTDYIPCKNNVNGRFKKGKLEELLIYLFAELCNWSNTDSNLHNVHLIMQALGYHSYKIATRRYRQMIENAKKEMKQNSRIRNRVRSIHSKVKNHKSIHCREYARVSKRLKEEKSVESILPLPKENISPTPTQSSLLNFMESSMESSMESFTDTSPFTSSIPDHEDTPSMIFPDLLCLSDDDLLPSYSLEDSFRPFALSDPFDLSVNNDDYPEL